MGNEVRAEGYQSSSGRQPASLETPSPSWEAERARGPSPSRVGRQGKQRAADLPLPQWVALSIQIWKPKDQLSHILSTQGPWAWKEVLGSRGLLVGPLGALLGPGRGDSGCGGRGGWAVLGCLCVQKSQTP